MNRCYIKSQAAGSKTKIGAVSGKKICLSDTLTQTTTTAPALEPSGYCNSQCVEDGVNHPGNSLKRDVFGITKVECSCACKNDTQCHAWTWFSKFYIFFFFSNKT